MYLPGASGTWRGMKGSDTLRSGMPESTACPPFLFSAGLGGEERSGEKNEKSRKYQVNIDAFTIYSYKSQLTETNPNLDRKEGGKWK